MRKEERRNEAGRHQKKGWRANVTRKEERKLDNKVAAEIGEMEQDLKMQKRFSVIRKELATFNCM